MNTQEKEFLSQLKPLRDYNERHELAADVIKMIAMGGFAAACLVTPGLAQVARLFPQPTGVENGRLRRLIKGLEDKGYIVQLGDKYTLTAEGILYYNKIKNTGILSPNIP